uniref:NR LBD domain-containing protein n=1 Tax=Caenorhabditis tropicalis TaxID=1561998 RepID=A0A1I7TEZ0_9PELO
MPNYYLKESDRILNKFQLKNESVRINQEVSQFFTPFLLFASTISASITYYKSTDETFIPIAIASIVCYLELATADNFLSETMCLELNLLEKILNLLPEKISTQKRGKAWKLINGGRINVEKARSHLKFSYVLLFISIYMGFLRKTTMEEPLMKDIVALFAASAASIFKSKNLLAADQNRSQRIREFEESFNH